MRTLSKILAVIGLAFSVWLFICDDPKSIAALLTKTGFALIAVSLIHVLPMTLNARGWQVLIPSAVKPNLATMLRIVWIRESVNGLLPVARIGGEVVSFRLMHKVGVRRAPAAAALVVDMSLGLLCQIAFTLLGLGMLGTIYTGDFVPQVFTGLVIMTAIAVLFICVQFARPFERMVALINRLAAGLLDTIIADCVRIDRAVRAIYHRREVLIRGFLWQFAGFLAASLEIWATLIVLGHPVGPADALAIEAVIAAVSSAGFLVPGAIGIQEGSFLLVGSMVGLDPVTALALAGARRLRDAIIFIPGLLAWHVAENQVVRTPAER